MKRLLTSLALGFGGFVLACVAYRTVLPFPEIDAVSDKLRVFRAHKDEFDTIFIGSSRTYHHVSPDIFDRVMLENGKPTHSFNFGIDGMGQPECGYMLEEILKTHPANLKWVFVELEELQSKWLFQGMGSRRALYWHDWKRTSLVLRKLLYAGTHFVWLPNPKRVLHALFKHGPRTRVAFHVSQFQRNFTNIGRASDVWNYFSSEPAAAKVNWVGKASDGYRPMTKRMSPAQAEDYKKELARALNETKPDLVSVYAEKASRQCAEEIRRYGATPVFFVHPSPTTQVEFAFRSKPPGAVLSFNNARLYPDLFRVDWRIDRSHMNQTGAEEFTRLMAVKFARLLNEGQVE